LARLKHDYPDFLKRGVEILAVGPHEREALSRYWRAHGLPFVGLPDPDHRVALQYRQEVSLFRLGRMPLVVVIDADGMIRYSHRATSMSDIPSNDSLLAAIDNLQAGSASDHAL